MQEAKMFTCEKIDKMKVSFQKIQYKSRYQESSITFSEYIYFSSLICSYSGDICLSLSTIVTRFSTT